MPLANGVITFGIVPENLAATWTVPTTTVRGDFSAILDFNQPVEDLEGADLRLRRNSSPAVFFSVNQPGEINITQLDTEGTRYEIDFDLSAIFDNTVQNDEFSLILRPNTVIFRETQRGPARVDSEFFTIDTRRFNTWVRDGISWITNGKIWGRR